MRKKNLQKQLVQKNAKQKLLNEIYSLLIFMHLKNDGAVPDIHKIVNHIYKNEKIIRQKVKELTADLNFHIANKSLVDWSLVKNEYDLQRQFSEILRADEESMCELHDLYIDFLFNHLKGGELPNTDKLVDQFYSDEISAVWKYKYQNNLKIDLEIMKQLNPDTIHDFVDLNNALRDIFYNNQ